MNGYLSPEKKGTPGIVTVITTSGGQYRCFIYHDQERTDQLCYGCDFERLDCEPDKTYHPWGGSFALFYTDSKGLYMKKDKKTPPLSPLWQEIVQLVANEIKCNT